MIDRRGAKKRILLSVPHMGGREQEYVQQAFASNWLSTVGPNLTAFEQGLGSRIGLPAVALSSGTAAIHLGLRLLRVGPGDEVFCPTLTFAASCNPVRYLGAELVFLDSDYATWALDLGESAVARLGSGRIVANPGTGLELMLQYRHDLHGEPASGAPTAASPTG